jgi:hypothetical protein
MTFEQAIELKEKLNSKYENLFITPKENNDFASYMTEFQFIQITDESAKLFSKSKTYNVTKIEIKMGNNYIIKNLSHLDL